MRATIFIGATAYAIADFGVIVAPAAVLASAAHKGGISGVHGLDLTFASATLGLAHAAIAFRRLVDEGRAARRVIDVWIASVDALVVLALASTVLLLVVLGGFADTHAVLVNRGWPVVTLWIGVQVLAVTAAEVTGRLVFMWLERGAARRPSPG